MPRASGTESSSHAGERFELVATALLALATVATAWSGYQATRWNEEQAKAFSHASAKRIESTKASDVANSQTEIDVATFTQWVDAYAKKDTKLAGFYFERFRKEFKPAVVAWIATRPLRNPRAPLTPFVMPQYKLAARAESERLQARAEGYSAAATTAIQRSSNYVLGAVLFAAALFFAGMSAKVSGPLERRILLALGMIVFIATVAWIATFPVSISV